MLFMGTIQGAIFNTYVKLPEGIRDGYSSENGILTMNIWWYEWI